MLKLPEDFSPEQRSARAKELFLEGYNCAQSVVLAFSDIIEAAGGPGKETLASFASGFGGGFGRLREVCGTVSGMTIMAGFLCPVTAPAGTAEAAAAKKENYTLVQSFANAFRQENGAIVCRELLGLRSAESPEPSPRTEQYYHKRPCAELCATAAGIVARKMIEDNV